LAVDRIKLVASVLLTFVLATAIFAIAVWFDPADAIGNVITEALVVMLFVIVFGGLRTVRDRRKVANETKRLYEIVNLYLSALFQDVVKFRQLATVKAPDDKSPPSNVDIDLQLFFWDNDRLDEVQLYLRRFVVQFGMADLSTRLDSINKQYAPAKLSAEQLIQLLKRPVEQDDMASQLILTVLSTQPFDAKAANIKAEELGALAVPLGAAVDELERTLETEYAPRMVARRAVPEHWPKWITWSGATVGVAASIALAWASLFPEHFVPDFANGIYGNLAASISLLTLGGCVAAITKYRSTHNRRQSAGEHIAVVIDALISVSQAIHQPPSPQRTLIIDSCSNILEEHVSRLGHIVSDSQSFSLMLELVTLLKKFEDNESSGTRELLALSDGSTIPIPTQLDRRIVDVTMNLITRLNAVYR
jgi:hypothetical protein